MRRFLPRFFRRARNIARAPPIRRSCAICASAPARRVLAACGCDRGRGRVPADRRLRAADRPLRPGGHGRRRPGRRLGGRRARRSARGHDRRARATWPRSSRGCRRRSRSRARCFACARRTTAAVRAASRSATPPRSRARPRSPAAAIACRWPRRWRASASYVFELLARRDRRRRHAGRDRRASARSTPRPSADVTPPQVVDFAVSLAGPCATVRFSTDEAATAAGRGPHRRRRAGHRGGRGADRVRPGRAVHRPAARRLRRDRACA